MVTVYVCVPVCIVFVEVGLLAGMPSLSASTGCVGDQMELVMSAGVHWLVRARRSQLGRVGKVRSILRRRGTLPQRDTPPAGVGYGCSDGHCERLPRLVDVHDVSRHRVRCLAGGTARRRLLRSPVGGDVLCPPARRRHEHEVRFGEPGCEQKAADGDRDSGEFSLDISTPFALTTALRGGLRNAAGTSGSRALRGDAAGAMYSAKTASSSVTRRV